MRAVMLLLGVLVASLAEAKPGDVVVAKRFGGAGLDYGWGLAADARGNLVLSGFGDTPVDGVFAMALSPAGAQRWSARLPTGASYYAGPLAVEAGGAALLTGDRGPALFFARVAGGKAAGAFTIDRASGLGVAAAPGGDVLLVGELRDEGTGFVGRYAVDGTPRWRQRLDGNGVDVAAGKDGSVTVAGSAAGDIFVERRAGDDGRLVWREKAGGDFEERRVQIALTGDGGVVAAYSSRPATLLRLGPDGKRLWTRSFEGINAGGVAVGRDGAIYVAIEDRLEAVGGDGAPRWTARLARQPELAGDPQLRGVAVDGQGRPCVTGSFTGTLSVGRKKLVAVPESNDVLLACFEP